MNVKLPVIALFLGMSNGLQADVHITKLGDRVVDEKALTIKGGFGQCINGLAFQQDALVTHRSHQYAAYYDAGRRVCLARRKLPDGDWRIIRFKDYDLMYAYSEDRGRTWLNNKGEPFPVPPGVASPDLKVVDIPRTHGLMNTHGQAVDSLGRIHAIMWHCTDKTLQDAGSKPGQHRWGPPGARRYHHYWRDVGGNAKPYSRSWCSNLRVNLMSPPLFVLSTFR